MNKSKKQRLEAKGWKVGTVREFLSLSPEESEYVELKLTLSKNLQENEMDVCRCLQAALYEQFERHCSQPSCGTRHSVRCSKSSSFGHKTTVVLYRPS